MTNKQEQKTELNELKHECINKISEVNKKVQINIGEINKISKIK